MELRARPPRGPRAAVRGPADPQCSPRCLRGREPRHQRARRRRRAGVRPDPHPSEASRRHGRLDLANRPRLTGGLPMPSDNYDVIIIGTGAGGGTLAHKLAPSGKRILLLERGGYLPREPENWDSREVFGNERYLADTERWIDKDG